MAGPFTWCAATIDPTTARERLTWTAAGMEGLCLKRRQEPCRPGGCGVDTGPPPLLRPLSEPSPDRRPQHGPCCWDAATPPACCTAPAGRLHSPAPSRCHWLGCWCRQQAGIRGRAPPVHRGLGRARRPGRRPRSARDRGGVADVARDAAGRRWHPVRLHRARPDVDPGTVPLFST